MTRLVLLPSPLTGAAVWEPVAGPLRDRGWRVTVVRLEAAVRTPADVLARFGEQLPDGEVVLVPHSNAGLYVAALAARRALRGLVFVDAALPSAEPATPTAPPALRAHLDRLPRDGAGGGQGRVAGPSTRCPASTCTCSWTRRASLPRCSGSSR